MFEDLPDDAIRYLYAPGYAAVIVAAKAGLKRSRGSS
jgi:hypothetical protein